MVPGVEDAGHLSHGGGDVGLLGGLHGDLVEFVADADAVADDVAAGGAQRHDCGVVQLLAVALHHTDDRKGLVFHLTVWPSAAAESPNRVVATVGPRTTTLAAERAWAWSKNDPALKSTVVRLGPVFAWCR